MLFGLRDPLSRVTSSLGIDHGSRYVTLRVIIFSTTLDFLFNNHFPWAPQDSLVLFPHLESSEGVVPLTDMLYSMR